MSGAHAVRWPLAGGAAHVWLLPADDRAVAADLDAALPLLSAGERARHARFVFPRDRDRYLLAHAALRLILADYGRASPASLVFEANQHGRPEIASPPALDGVRFNLSHTQGLIAVAVCRDRDIGVDVEWHGRRTTDVQTLAGRFFSPIEARALAHETPEDRAERFFDYWTLKESYIKARGLGLALPLDAFSFTLEGAAAPRIAIEIDASLGDDARDWRFLLARPTPEHTLAAAVRTGDEEIRFVVRNVSMKELL